MNNKKHEQENSATYRWALDPEAWILLLLLFTSLGVWQCQAILLDRDTGRTCQALCGQAQAARRWFA